MKSFKDIFGKLFSKEKRRAERLPSPRLAAHYWNGGSPSEHRVRDISSTGLFVLTEERWYPGTVLLMTLQKMDKAEGSPDRSIAVQSKAVRWGSDGVGLEFVMQDPRDLERSQSGLAGGADRKSLEKFLEGFGVENGSVVIKSSLPPSHLSPKASTIWS